MDPKSKNMTMIFNRQSEGHKWFISSNDSHEEVRGNRETLEYVIGPIFWFGSRGLIYLNKNTIKIHKMLNMAITWKNNAKKNPKPICRSKF